MPPRLRQAGGRRLLRTGRRAGVFAIAATAALAAAAGWRMTDHAPPDAVPHAPRPPPCVVAAATPCRRRAASTAIAEAQPCRLRLSLVAPRSGGGGLDECGAGGQWMTRRSGAPWVTTTGGAPWTATAPSPRPGEFFWAPAPASNWPAMQSDGGAPWGAASPGDAATLAYSRPPGSPGAAISVAHGALYPAYAPSPQTLAPPSYQAVMSAAPSAPDLGGDGWEAATTERGREEEGGGRAGGGTPPPAYDKVCGIDAKR
ncbi:PREDICTED: skin secretory protein xP2-like [Priapulus caudatus]|uniref:Skin secretory protein xP2-like n=1 Tax=Priapulus caudatus TaxID=37621 RepID=A0ABM1F3L1_PRICU|nr:PREDICTED: skin secretory protein xP2-like [Priapulus caudatus]